AIRRYPLFTMDEKALARRLAAYSATAAVALTVAPEAGAQVVYHDFEPDITECWIYLDFDDDGVEDLRVSRDDYWNYCDRQGGRSHTFWLHLRIPNGGNPQNGAVYYNIYGF